MLKDVKRAVLRAPFDLSAWIAPRSQQVGLSVIPATRPVIPAFSPVIPAFSPVLPAKAGIQPFIRRAPTEPPGPNP